MDKTKYFREDTMADQMANIFIQKRCYCFVQTLLLSNIYSSNSEKNLICDLLVQEIDSTEYGSVWTDLPPTGRWRFCASTLAATVLHVSIRKRPMCSFSRRWKMNQSFAKPKQHVCPSYGFPLSAIFKRCHPRTGEADNFQVCVVCLLHYALCMTCRI